MFKNLNLKPMYNSFEEDVVQEFYEPVLSNAITYDRASAYFSAKALSNCAEGIELFSNSGGKCRLIISTEVTEEDYNEIEKGYKLKKELSEDLIHRLKEDIILKEQKNLSNLAYLISIGTVEIKIAYTYKGIFHAKFGVLKDRNNNIICFRGSNNATEAAVKNNYEEFDVTCSWLASEFDNKKITKSQNSFEEFWNNDYQGMTVLDMEDIMKKEILKFNKGQIIYDEMQLIDNCFLLDYDGNLKLELKDNENKLHKVKNFKLRRFIDKKTSNDKTIMFKEDIGYLEYKKIINILKSDSEKKGYRFVVSNRLTNYIASRELYIEERKNIGLTIKNKDASILNEFEKYKDMVNSLMVRPLREKQMWDSFFMYSMKKSSNFSVPGSGKTASVLGTFAYLNKTKNIKRIVMIGPKNSFGSWKDEFVACFGEQIKLSVFDLHSSEFKDKKYALNFNTGGCNLILINYESLGTYLKELKSIIKSDTLLVFDEVHKVKAIEGVWAENVLKLSKNASYMIAMTGTPIPNSYLDISNLLHILYAEEYNDFFGFSEGELKKPDDYQIELINNKLQPFFCRTNKKQLNVPQVNEDIIVPVMATKEENRLFNILLLKYRKNKFELIMRILQQESNPTMLLNSLELQDFSDILDISLSEEEIDFYDYSDEMDKLIKAITNTSKKEICVKQTNELCKCGKKVIIWCIFRDSILSLQKQLEKMGWNVQCIYGDVEVEDRDDIIQSFKTGSIDVLITNPHTLAESVSLHSVCHDAIYFEYSYNLVHLLQSKDRIHRLGLKEQQYTQYYFLQQHFITEEGIPYSLDEKIYDRLMEKEQMMLSAIDNNVLEKGYTAQEDVEYIFGKLDL